MPKILIRIVAVILVPCLTGDAVTVMGSIGPVGAVAIQGDGPQSEFHPIQSIQISGRHGSLPLQWFTVEALAVPNRVSNQGLGDQIAAGLNVKAEEALESNPSSSDPKRRILIADGNADLRDVLKRHFEQSGFAVVSASVEEACHLVIPGQFDLLIANDPNLGLSGVPFITTALQSDPNLGVVYLGTDPQGSPPIESIDSAIRRIEFPFHLGDLSGAIQNLLAALPGQSSIEGAAELDDAPVFPSKRTVARDKAYNLLRDPDIRTVLQQLAEDRSMLREAVSRRMNRIASSHYFVNAMNLADHTAFLDRLGKETRVRGPVMECLYAGYDPYPAFALSAEVDDVFAYSLEEFGVPGDIVRLLRRGVNAEIRGGHQYDTFDTLEDYKKLQEDFGIHGLGGLGITRVSTQLRARITGIFYFQIGSRGNIQWFTNPRQLKFAQSCKHAVIEFEDPVTGRRKRYWHLRFEIGKDDIGIERFLKGLQSNTVLIKGDTQSFWAPSLRRQAIGLAEKRQFIDRAIAQNAWVIADGLNRGGDPRSFWGPAGPPLRVPLRAGEQFGHSSLDDTGKPLFVDCGPAGALAEPGDPNSAMRSKSSPLKAPADREILRFWQRNLSDALIFLSRRGIVPLGHGKVILKAIKAKKSEIAEMSYPEAECALWEQRMIALEDLSDLLRVMDPNQRHLLRAFARIDKNSSTEDPLFQFDLNATGQRPRVTGTIAFKLKQEYPIVIIRFEHPGGNDAGRAKPLKEFRLGVDKIIVRGLKNAAIQAQSREHVSTFLIHLDGADIDPGTNHYVEPWMHNVRLTEGWSYDVDPRNIIDVFRRSMERWVALCCEIETQARPTIGRQLNAHDNLMRRSS